MNEMPTRPGSQARALIRASARRPATANQLGVRRGLFAAEADPTREYRAQDARLRAQRALTRSQRVEGPHLHIELRGVGWPRRWACREPHRGRFLPKLAALGFGRAPHLLKGLHVTTVSKIIIETKLPDDPFERAAALTRIKPALDELLEALPEATITHKIVTERGTRGGRQRKEEAA